MTERNLLDPHELFKRLEHSSFELTHGDSIHASTNPLTGERYSPHVQIGKAGKATDHCYLSGQTILSMYDTSLGSGHRLGEFQSLKERFPSAFKDTGFEVLDYLKPKEDSHSSFLKSLLEMPVVESPEQKLLREAKSFSEHGSFLKSLTFASDSPDCSSERMPWKIDDHYEVAIRPRENSLYKAMCERIQEADALYPMYGSLPINYPGAPMSSCSENSKPPAVDTMWIGSRSVGFSTTASMVTAGDRTGLDW